MAVTEAKSNMSVDPADAFPLAPRFVKVRECGVFVRVVSDQRR